MPSEEQDGQDCFAGFSNPVAVTTIWQYPCCRVAR